jgi:hypothetical protein
MYIKNFIRRFLEVPSISELEEMIKKEDQDIEYGLSRTHTLLSEVHQRMDKLIKNLEESPASPKLKPGQPLNWRSQKRMLEGLDNEYNEKSSST